MTAVSAFELATGTVVGSYRILREIGHGGMGTVYECKHTVLPRRAAVKVMHADLLRLPGMATRVVQEATILEDLRHPGLVRVFECNILPDRRPYIAMELVEGETLAERLRYGTVSPVELCGILEHIADVLAAVHAQGVVHRDLKPDNIILTPPGDSYPLRVVDWGVARLDSVGRLTLEGLTPGTPIYMSPEQATGNGIGPACDIYSLGVVAYEVLAGRPPFDGRTLVEVVCQHLAGEAQPLEEITSAPAELCRLIHQMLDKDPSMRPGAIEIRQLARAMAQNLESEYESYQLDRREVVDADVLECGNTERMPALPRPRWTPEIGQVPHAVAVADVARAAANRRRG
jgi:serine/threonine-protein kinase|nr:serine/threonine-protein kinase [Kofleriaceae bacterium]